MTTKKSLSLSQFGKRSVFPTTNAKAKNEDWPEIISVGMGDEGRKVEMSTQPEEPRQVNVKHISTGDLEMMKKKDSFAYYSIPGVRRAKLLQKDIDMSNLVTSDMSRSCISCPSRLQTSKANAQSQTVARRSRISFECHPDLLEEEEDDYSDSDEGSDDEDDPLDALLASMGNK